MHPVGSKGGKNLDMKVVPEMYVTSFPSIIEEYLWSSSVNVIVTPLGFFAVEQLGIFEKTVGLIVVYSNNGEIDAKSSAWRVNRRHP